MDGGCSDNDSNLYRLFGARFTLRLELLDSGPVWYFAGARGVMQERVFCQVTYVP